MDKLTKLFKHGRSHSSSSQGAEPATQAASSFPTTEDIFRSRKQRGVNLGSWFVLEKWIAETPFRFAHEPGQSDLDVARGTHAREVLEHHWDTWIIEQDWAWIAERGINTVRIPIGYYHISGADPSVLKDTDFADRLDIYQGAWGRITKALVTANRFGLGVLIDLHAAPGKQNQDAHSGASHPPQFFQKSYNMAHTIHVLSILLKELLAFSRSQSPPLHNLVGIELLNEPQQDGKLEKWYLETSKALRQIDSNIPIYIGDSWMTDHYASFLADKAKSIPFIALDHHLYRCFTPKDISTPAKQHINDLTDPNAGTPQLFARVAQKLESAGDAMIVGEWSGALNPGSLSGLDGHTELEMRKQYITAQLTLYEQHCAGYFFWTYKKEHGSDKGWSFRDAVEAGVFPSRVGLQMQIESNGHDNAERNTRMTAAKDKALGEHVGYWSQYPGKYEHWRFEDGFRRGWEDAYIFFDSAASLPRGAPVPELGFKGAWAKIRAQENVKEKGDGPGLWEFEHGYSQGVGTARKDLESRNHR